MPHPLQGLPPAAAPATGGPNGCRLSAAALLLAAGVALAGCAPPPFIAPAAERTGAVGAYPDLVPLPPVLTRADAAAAAADAEAGTGPVVQSRAAALRARSAALRAPVVPASVRARMAQGVETSALP